MGEKKQRKALNRLYILYILDILREYSDETHRLSKGRISKLIVEKFDVYISPNAVKDNLYDMLRHGGNIDLGFDVKCKESSRIGKSGIEESYCTGWYLERDISDAELRHIIDNLMFSKNLPYNECKRLVENLKKLSRDKYGTSEEIKFIKALPGKYPQNNEYFKNIEIINKAIAQKNQISFLYHYFGTDKQLHVSNPKKAGKSSVRKVSPYALVMANSRHYMICSHDKEDGRENDNAYHYRVDLMKNVKILDKLPMRSMNEIKGLEKGLNVTKYMGEHIYMYSSPSMQVTFSINHEYATTVIDWFGMDATFGSIGDDGMVNVTVHADEVAMYYWLLQYGTIVKVISPDDMVDKVRDAIKGMCEKYEIPTLPEKAEKQSDK